MKQSRAALRLYLLHDRTGSPVVWDWAFTVARGEWMDAVMAAAQYWVWKFSI
jgi:hypothetical protein